MHHDLQVLTPIGLGLGSVVAVVQGAVAQQLAEPFPSFTFSPAGASVYQLASFGTARKELKALTP